LSPIPLATRFLANLPTRPPAAPPIAVAASRREQADDDADADADLHSLAAQVVARLRHVNLALRVLVDQDDAVARHRLVLYELHERVEVLLGEIRNQIDGDQDVQRLVTHGPSSF
jgi:hypothetical protein